jgi:hypothetical protein
MSSSAGPPAYAWDWFSRQRLLWREARSRLASGAEPHASRYGRAAAKPDVIPMLRLDYPDDEVVRTAVHATIRDLIFLGRTDRPFGELGIRNPPRGLRWWWRALTGEDVEHPPPAAAPPRPATQLEFEDILRGYGD